MLHAGIKRWLASGASKAAISRLKRFMTLVDCNELRRRCTAAKILHGGIKRLKHPALGSVELESSALSVDGRPGPGMIVYTPVDCAMAGRIGRLAASA